MVLLRVTAEMAREMRDDLARPHAFAAERMGFLHCRAASLLGAGLLLLAYRYSPIEDGDYLDVRGAGATMGPHAIRKAMQIAFTNKSGLFHVHLHHHTEQPWFSGLDLRENAKFVPDFFNVSPYMPHGAVVLSLDRFAGLYWTTKAGRPCAIHEITEVGAPMVISRKSQ